MTTDTSADTSAAAPHVPVMIAACLEGLDVRPGQWYVDGTFGAGGHSRALLAAGASVLAVDQDPNVRPFAEQLAAEQGARERFVFVAGNFRHLDRHVEAAGLSSVAGVLLDLGVSSMQLDEAERGFAFRQEGPLDMRMGEEEIDAADVVNEYPQDELAAIIYRYGEERHSRRVARRIAEAREQERITTTEQLADIVVSAYPPGRRREHPARRTFQALRIYVNDELGALEDGLGAAARVLGPGGRLVVLSYHSLEDRIVKHTAKEHEGLEPVHKKPLTASDEEILQNPRARSAKLRTIRKRPPETQTEIVSTETASGTALETELEAES
ncbi:MAG: 16S rRNA (cytosine(1402)-N(4))-methyltransferase RsmH [Trueperaceae bacterium]|nr:16S rRNA (cytosine(1402)-N(4))-methyltransferase RsmH [Trueperaceae bacterium]